MNNTIQEKEDILDNELLSKFDLLDYDIERTFYRVCMFMKKYRKRIAQYFEYVSFIMTFILSMLFVSAPAKPYIDCFSSPTNIYLVVFLKL